MSRISRNSVKHQVTPFRPASPGTRHRIGGPPGTRTRNLRIKSPLLYPIELEAREREYTNLIRAVSGVTEGTRTPNPQDHNLVL